MNRFKKYAAVGLVAASLLISQMACDDTVPNSPRTPKSEQTNSTSHWRKCASLSCTVFIDGHERKVVIGSKVNASKSRLGSGNWITVNGGG